MDRTTFMIIVNGIKDSAKMEFAIDEAVKNLPVFETFMINLSLTPANKALYSLLRESFTEKEIEFIEWWLWDNNEKVLYNPITDEIVVHLDTLDDLYDYLTTPELEDDDERYNSSSFNPYTGISVN